MSSLVAMNKALLSDIYEDELHCTYQHTNAPHIGQLIGGMLTEII